jgi:hypothetical protein
MLRARHPNRLRSALRYPLAMSVILVATAGIGSHPHVHAQSPPGATVTPSHLTIPYLASTRPGDIEFAAAECDIATGGDRMTCRFRQVFVTVASIDTTACVITSNGYEQSFRRQTPTRWVSVGVPTGACGLVETTTLDDGGGTRWTMTVGTIATNNVDRAECRVAEGPETYGWQNLKRPLPCSTIQPGSIER